MPGPLPAGWPRLSSALFYRDGSAAITFLQRAFGFVTRMRHDDDLGRVAHSELVYGEGVVMVSSLREDNGEPLRAASPLDVGGRNTQSLFMYVDDVDAHCDRARAAGATILTEPSDTDYGEGYWADRGYGALDCEGHRWWFATRIRTG